MRWKSSVRARLAIRAWTIILLWELAGRERRFSPAFISSHGCSGMMKDHESRDQCGLRTHNCCGLRVHLLSPEGRRKLGGMEVASRGIRRVDNGLCGLQAVPDPRSPSREGSCPGAGCL